MIFQPISYCTRVLTRNKWNEKFLLAILECICHVLYIGYSLLSYHLKLHYLRTIVMAVSFKILYNLQKLENIKF